MPFTQRDWLVAQGNYSIDHFPLGYRGPARPRHDHREERDEGRDYSQLKRETPALSKSKRPPATNTPVLTMKTINSKLLNADNQRIRWDQGSRQSEAEYRGSTPPTRGSPCVLSAPPSRLRHRQLRWLLASPN